MQLTTILPAVLNKIRQGSTFLSVMGYRNNFNEVSNIGIVFHANYIRAVDRAITTWMKYEPKNDLEQQAKLELIASFTDTLNGKSRSTSAHAYETITDGDQTPIKGVKWWSKGEEVHLWGFQVHKIVIVPGTYLPDRRRPLTVAKDNLRKLTQLERFRQFKLVEGRFDHVGVDNLTLTHQDLLEGLV